MIKYYQQELPAYPKKTDLFSGLVSNRLGLPVDIQLSYTLVSAKEKLTDSVDCMIAPGINHLLPVILKSNPGRFDSLVYLEPGDYLFTMWLQTGEQVIKTERAFTVAQYKVSLIKEDSNTINVITEPAINLTGVYICVKEVSGYSKRGKKKNGCFYLSQTSFSKNQLIPDSASAFVYEVYAYYNNNLIARTGFKSWEELTTTGLQLSAEEYKDHSTSGAPRKVQLNAAIGVEFGYTNVRYPNQLSAAQYTRLFFKPIVTLLGVPLTVNTMLTTEAGKNYPMNFFQFGFDANKFRNDFQNNAAKDLLDTEHRLELNTAELNDVNQQLEKYSRHNDPASIVKDTPGFSVKHNLRVQRKERKRQEIDQKISELNLRKEILEHQRYKDSVYLNTRRWDDRDTLQRFIKKQRHIGLTKTLLAIRSFNIGQCTPYYSDITLSQVPLQGIHADLKYEKWFLSATAGNRITFQPALGLRNLLQPVFENKTYAGKIGIAKRRSHSSVYVSYFYFENKPDSFNYTPRKNSIISVGGESRFVPWLLFAGEVAKSFYENNSEDAFNSDRYQMIRSFSKNYGNLSVNCGLTLNATSSTDISFNAKRIGGGYYTLGVPFLRNDNLEYSVSWKQFYWLRQLQTELMYMQNRDNLEGNKSYNTVLTGYGASLKTHFRNLPNLLLLYKPFNSSFSFEDNLFNQGNAQPGIITQQFYLFHATLFFNKLLKQQGNFNSSISYNRSNNHNSSGITYALETVTGTASFTDKQKHLFAYTVSLYQSSIHFNNSMLHDASYSSFFLKNKIKITIGGITQWVNDGRQRTGLYNQAGYNIGKLTIAGRLAFNYLKGNWFIDNPTLEHAVNLYMEWQI